MKQYNIIMDVLGRWSRDLEHELNELFGSKSKGVLHNMQNAIILETLNMSRTFKVATCTMIIALHLLTSFLQYFPVHQSSRRLLTAE